MINPDDAAAGHLRATPERERIVYRTRYTVNNMVYLEDEDMWQIFLIEVDGMSATVLTVTPTQSVQFLLGDVWTSENALEPA